MSPAIPTETDIAVSTWMRRHGWQVTTTWWQADPETGFHVWQEEAAQQAKSHALCIPETMVRQLRADELIEVLNRERIAEDIRASFKVFIEERGSEYRVSVVPRRSGEFKVQE